MLKMNQDIQVKFPGATSYRIVGTELGWTDQYIFFKKGSLRDKIELSAALSWKRDLEPDNFNIKQQKQKDVKHVLVLVTRGAKGPEEWRLLPDRGDIDTWAFWITASLQEWASRILTETPKGISMPHHQVKTNAHTGHIFPLKTKGLVQTQSTLKRFDKEMRLFSEAVGQLVNAKEDLSNVNFANTDDVPRERLQDNIPTDKNFKYNMKDGLKLTSGGSGTTLVSMKVSKSVILDDGQFYNPPDEPVVLKTACIDPVWDKGHLPDAAVNLIRETRLLAAIGRHPNIIGLVDAVALNTGICLFLEKGEGSLKDWGEKNNLNRDDLLNAAYGIFEGLGHMHERGVYHLDIKPGNIVFSADKVPKVIDFGLACCKILDDYKEMFKNFANNGTTGYFPMECFAIKSPSKSQIEEYLAKRDAYATGMTFLDGLIGPYFGLRYAPLKDTGRLAYETHKQKWWDAAIKKKLPGVRDGELLALISLTLEMIQPDIQARPTLAEARDIFRAGCGKIVEAELIRLRTLARQDKIKRSRHALDRYTFLNKMTSGRIDFLKKFIFIEEQRY